jgi:hypothetical protein
MIAECLLRTHGLPCPGSKIPGSRCRHPAPLRKVRRPGGAVRRASRAQGECAGSDSGIQTSGQRSAEGAATGVIRRRDEGYTPQLLQYSLRLP